VSAGSESTFTCREQTATCGESLCDVVRHHMLADDDHGTLNEVRHQTPAQPTYFHGDGYSLTLYVPGEVTWGERRR
jgi:hypothetical protein